jgi:signal transduction histidine kinase
VHGGTIIGANDPEGGAVFTFTLNDSSFGAKP